LKPTVVVPVATAFSFFLSGYYLNDLLIYLPLTAYLQDPSLYPGNPLIAQLQAMPYPAYRAFALVSDPWFMFATFAISRMLLVISLWMLARQLVKDCTAAVVSIALLLIAPAWFGTLGGTSLLQPEPSQFDLAVPFCLFALAAALAGRATLAFLLAGLGFNLQPILGLVAMSLVGVELILNQLLYQRRRRFSELVLPIVWGVAITLPMVVQTFTGLGGRLVAQPDDYVEIVKFTAFYQIFPSSFLPVEYASTFILGLGVLMVLRNRRSAALRTTLALWLATIVVFCAIGTVFSEFLPSSFILKLMPFRATLYFKVVAMLLCVGVAWHLAGRTRIGRLAFVGASTVAILLAALQARPILLPGFAPATDLELAAGWARQNTARDAVFATPPDPSVTGFTLFAERSTLGDYKLATQAVWDPGFARTMYQRLAALGCPGPWDPWCAHNQYGSFGDADFSRLSQEFGACYALTQRAQQLDFPIVFENTSLRIYSLCS
jgi:hypothetical protein